MVRKAPAEMEPWAPCLHGRARVLEPCGPHDPTWLLLPPIIATYCDMNRFLVPFRFVNCEHLRNQRNLVLVLEPETINPKAILKPNHRNKCNGLETNQNPFEWIHAEILHNGPP